MPANSGPPIRMFTTKPKQPPPRPISIVKPSSRLASPAACMIHCGAPITV
jgi:hypothetical protein